MSAEEEVRKQLDEGYPESFILGPDDPEVIGYAVRLEEAVGKFGPVKILVMRVGDKLFSVWLSHTALQSKLERARPRAGDLLGIRYLGKRSSSSGQDYVDYNVVVHGAKGNELSWGESQALPPADNVPVEAEIVDEGDQSVSYADWK